MKRKGWVSGPGPLRKWVHLHPEVTPGGPSRSPVPEVCLTWPGRPGRACALGSWRCGYTRPPGCLPGAAVLPRVPHQRGPEAVAARQSNEGWRQGAYSSGQCRTGHKQGAGRGEGQGRGGPALGPGPGAAHLSRVGVEALDEVHTAPDGWKGGSLAYRSAPAPIQLPAVRCVGEALFSPAQPG